MDVRIFPGRPCDGDEELLRFNDLQVIEAHAVAGSG
jgi:hypothetical protein